MPRARPTPAAPRVATAPADPRAGPPRRPGPASEAVEAELAALEAMLPESPPPPPAG